MSTQTKVWTEADLLALPNVGKYELVEGELIMSPAGFMDHGRIIARLLARLTTYVDKQKLGVTSDGQTGCWMTSGNLRCPDVSFLSKARVKASFGQKSVFLQGAPDLAIEVLSPNESARMIDDKIADYFESGARLVWIVNPADKTVGIYRSVKLDRTLRSGDELSGEDVVPGFSMPVDEVFKQPELD
jgi:Uma2 family endonuclease